MSDIESNLETNSGSEAEGESSLDDLYTSFKFESNTESQPPIQVQARHALPTSGSSNTLMYLNAQLTAHQSCLLVYVVFLTHKKRSLSCCSLSVHLSPKALKPTSVHKLKAGCY